MLRLSVFMVVIFVSCQPKQTQIVQKRTTGADSILVDSTQMRTADVVVPVIAPLPKIEILFTGTFHGDEVRQNIEALPWLGLFADDHGNFVLRETKIIAQRVVDGLVDDVENGEKTGWQIDTENGQHPTLLVTGGDFTEGQVAAGQIPVAIYPGDSVQFDFNGDQYVLFATGVSVIDSAAGVNHVSEYNLFVVRTHAGRSAHASLVSHPSFDDAMTSILWSGDIDRDGYMDFVIDMSSHYNQRLPTLFLSKPAKDNQVVIPVAEHSSVGC